MDKMTAGLLGAVAGLATMGVAQAATTQAVSPSQALQASSYADLLEPIPNAAALLQADNGWRTEQLSTSASFQLADWRGEYGRNNHHHHHQRYDNYYGYYNRGRNEHHHHHHHNNSFVGIPGVGGFVVHNGHD